VTPAVYVALIYASGGVWHAFFIRRLPPREPMSLWVWLLAFVLWPIGLVCHVIIYMDETKL
jgi:hypothetical protein